MDLTFVGEFSRLVTRERRTARWPEERAVVEAIRETIPEAIWRKRFRAAP